MSRLTDEEAKKIAEAVVTALAKDNVVNNHEQLKSMFRMEAALAKATEDLARKDAVIADLQTRLAQFSAILIPSSSPTAPPPPFVPPITYQVPMSYPGSTVTAPVAPPATTSIMVPNIPSYGEYQPAAIPSQNGHSAE